MNWMSLSPEEWRTRIERLDPGRRSRLREALQAALASRGETTGRRLIAYVEAPEEPGLVDQIRSSLSARLPEYMVPSVFVRMDALPLTPNGKVDRKALPAWDGSRSQLSQPYAAPRSRVEERLAAIWGEVLGVDRVGIRDNFFELGGDSIRCVQVLARAREEGLSFTMQQVFVHSTIEALAPLLEVTPVSAAMTGSQASFRLISERDRAQVPDAIEDAYPLSALQMGMLFHTELNPDEALYCDILSAELEGGFDLPSLHLALERLVARHPVLRTSFALGEYSEPLQLVHREGVVSVEVEDLAGLSADEAESRVRDWIASEPRRGFDWRHLPLMRFRVHLRDSRRFQFSLVVHHAVLDGWSAATMMSEIFRSYRDSLEGLGSTEEAPLALRFVDFIALEREAVESEACRAFWADRLQDATACLLPRWPGRADEEGAGLYQSALVPPQTAARLRDLARVLGIPLKSVLLAVHARVVARITGQEDVVTGVISNGRPESADGERVLGLFLNTVPLRLRLRGGTWGELVESAFREEQNWTPYRRYPLAEMQARHGELFDTAFNFTHFHVYRGIEEIGGPRVLGTVVAERTNFALLCTFSVDGPSGLQLELAADGSKLSPGQLEAVTDLYLRVLDGVDAEARYESADLLSAKDRRSLLEEWSGAAGVAAPEPSLLHSRFEEQCRLQPEAIALVAGRETRRYAELNSRANRIARVLRRCGAGPEQRVGVFLRRTSALLETLLGILKAGACYVPLDPAYPAERTAQMVELGGVEWIVSELEIAAQLLPHPARLVLLDGVAAVDGRRLEEESGEDLGAVATSGNLAYMIFTSGSTGVPKPVGIEHASASALIEWAGGAFPPEAWSGVFAATSICFDLSIFELFAPLSLGGKVVLGDDLLALPDLESAGEVTLINTVPSVLSELLAARPLPPGVRTINLAGEALPRSLADRLFELPSVQEVRNLYGPSEATTYSTWAPVARGSSEPPTIGRPIDGTLGLVLDAWLQPAPVGVPGELYLGGAGLARGYLGEPAATARAFVPSPFAAAGSPGSRLYRTGDRARWLPEGRLEFLGRRDDQVKVRGYRIELGEIEARLRQHPSVREAVVTLSRDDGNDPLLVAYLVAHADRVPTPSELRDFLRRGLPAAMTPGAFVVLPELPRGTTGKVDRRALPPVSDAARIDRGEGGKARTEVEELLLNIWSEVLRIDSVGIHDDFFALGGHSLLAIRAVSRVRDAFAVELPLRILFQHPTVASLAPLVEQGVREGWGLPMPRIEAEEGGAEIPMSHAQERLWFLDHLAPGSPAYNLPAAVQMLGVLHPEAMEAALVEVVRRHAVLRTVLRLVDGKPAQVVLEAPRRLLNRVDLTGLPADRRQNEALRWVADEASRPFDLALGPLLRTVLVGLSEDENWLLFTLHHIAGDFWSSEILRREWAVLYAAFAAGRPSPLEPLAIQYADYARWERRWLTSEVLEWHLHFWRRQLADAPPLLNLAPGRYRASIADSRGRQEPFHLSQEQTEKLRDLARSAGVTLFMALLAAFQVILHRLSGRDDVIVGTDVANRGRRETEGLIGFFINQLVLRTSLAGNPTFRELLLRVREVTLAAYSHQDLPFEKLVEGLRVERSLSYAPIFQVKLVVQNALASTETELPGLRLLPLPVEKGTSQFDLVLNVADATDGLVGGLEHNLDVLSAEDASDFVTALGDLIEEVVVDPSSRLDQLVAAIENGLRERHAKLEDALRLDVRRKLRQVRREPSRA